MINDLLALLNLVYLFLLSDDPLSVTCIVYSVMPPLAAPDVSEHPNMTRAGPGTGSKCFTTAANVSQLSSLSQNHSALSVNINQKHAQKMIKFSECGMKGCKHSCYGKMLIQTS